MSQVHTKVPQPLATNMCSIEFETLMVAVEQRAFDVVLSDLWYYGGCLITKHLDFVATHLGLALGMHSGVEFGLGTAHMVHCAVAMPNLVHASDSHYHHLTNDILTEPLVYHNGYMRPPTGPRWGVTLDEEKVIRYQELCNKLRSGQLQGKYLCENYYTYPPDPQRPTWYAKIPAWYKGKSSCVVPPILNNRYFSIMQCKHPVWLLCWRGTRQKCCLSPERFHTWK